MDANGNMKEKVPKKAAGAAKPKRQAPLKQQKQRVISLVTGSTTALGVRLIQKLLERGDEVRVIIKEHPHESPKWAMLPRGVIPYISDLRQTAEHDQKTLEEACKGVANIFHLAGATYRKKHTPDEFIDINVIGTDNLLKAYIDANDHVGNLHIMYTSTINVYGYRRTGETLTEESPTNPVTPYGKSKLMAEDVIKAFSAAHDHLHYTIFRLAQIYGPGYEQPYFYEVFKRIFDQKMRLIGGGNNHLALVHIDDVVAALIEASENPVSYNKTYNLTDGQSYTAKQLFEKAATFMGVQVPSKNVNPALVRLTAKARNIDMDGLDFITSDRIISTEKVKGELHFKAERSIDVDGSAWVREFAKSVQRA